MIKSNLAVLMAQREMNISNLSKETGISRNTISSLYNNEAKGIQFETLNKLCDYFEVDVNDIISKMYAHIRLDKITASDDNLVEIDIFLEVQDINTKGTLKVETSNSNLDIMIPTNIYKRLSVIPSGRITEFLNREIVIPVINELKISPERYTIKVLNPEYINDPAQETKYMFLSMKPL